MCTAGIIHRLIVSLLVLVVCGGAAPEATTPEPSVLFAEPKAKRTEGDANTERETKATTKSNLEVFPVTVEVCGESVTFSAPPERAVTNDVNITEIFLDAGLKDKLVGYSGVSDVRDLGERYRRQLEDIPRLSPKYIDLEALVGVGPDFFFAGWNYGFSSEKGITPAALEQYGIRSYVLTESCIRIMEREQVSLEDTFTDLINIGRIFGVEAYTQVKVEQYRAELAKIERVVGVIEDSLRVFVYDSGADTPMTAAKFAMPNAMIEAAGGTNIFNDVASSWVHVNWEDVVDRNPEHIVIIDYDEPNAQGKLDFLKSQVGLADIDAIRNDKFVVLDYAEATPGPRNVASTYTLAKAFYPDRFSNWEMPQIPLDR